VEKASYYTTAENKKQTEFPETRKKHPVSASFDRRAARDGVRRRIQAQIILTIV